MLLITEKEVARKALHKIQEENSLPEIVVCKGHNCVVANHVSAQTLALLKSTAKMRA